MIAATSGDLVARRGDRLRLLDFPASWRHGLLSAPPGRRHSRVLPARVSCLSPSRFRARKTHSAGPGRLSWDHRAGIKGYYLPRSSSTFSSRRAGEKGPFTLEDGCASFRVACSPTTVLEAAMFAQGSYR